MKKLFQLVTAFMIVIGIFAGVGVTKSKADYVLWGGKGPGGELGYITPLKDIKFYKYNDDMSLSVVIGKKGVKYPVYNIFLPHPGYPTRTYGLGEGMKRVPPQSLIKYENIQRPYIIKHGTWKLYVKTYSKPYEWVYVNYRKDDKWVKADKVQLDQYGFVRTPVFDVKSYGTATWQ